MALLKKLGALARRLAAHRGGSGLTHRESTDLGIDGVPPGEEPTVEDETMAGTGTGLIPGQAQGALQVVTASPSFVSRPKCPHGYSFVAFGGRTELGMGHVRGTCVLTKVARALGLIRRRRGRGISARDLRAALRVTRLVKHIEL